MTYLLQLSGTHAGIVVVVIVVFVVASHWSTSDFGRKLKWPSDSQCRRFVMVPTGCVAK